MRSYGGTTGCTFNQLSTTNYKTTWTDNKKSTKKLQALKKKQNISPWNSTETRQDHPDVNFYARVDNLSHITFGEEEINLLKHGFQYSIERPIAPYLISP